VNLVFRPAAAADVEEAFLWYEAQRPGLGAEFLRAIEEVSRTILQAPPIPSSIATLGARTSRASPTGSTTASSSRT